jgi:hypothetical protein
MTMPIRRVEWTTLYNLLGNRRSEQYWVPGEHLSIIGPTQAGKTYLMLCLFPLRRYVTYYVAKAEDKTLKGLTGKKQGDNRFRKIGDYSYRHNWEYRILLWPESDQLEDEAKQQHVFYRALRQQFRERGWTIVVDEVAYFCDIKLGNVLANYWRRASSLKLSLMAATQRPAGVPLLMYSAPHHLFFFRFQDETDLKRIGGIGWINRQEIRETVSKLGRYEFLYIHTPSGYMAISKAEKNT